MKTKTIMLSLVLFVGLAVKAQETKWTIDPVHSNISFGISHFMIATVTGGFDEFSGTISSEGDDITNASIVIKATSINTKQEPRDKHLRSADFFNVEVNPEITFSSTSIKKEEDKNYIIEGSLTMNGITKPITLNASYKGSFIHPRFKKTIGVMQVNGSIPRLDFKVGTKFPAKALGKDVKFKVNIEMTKEE